MAVPLYQQSRYGKWYPGKPGDDTSQTTIANAVTAAADKYKIPPAILWGVLGVETDFGKGIKTSSAGARGIGQFMPGTAPLYDYPYVNSNDIGVITKQIDGTAHYLSDLAGPKPDAGDWDAALRSYSGGGYGLSEALKKGASNPKSDFVAPHAEAVQSTNDIVKLFGLVAGGLVLGKVGAGVIGAGEAAAGEEAAAGAGGAAAGAGAGAAAETAAGGGIAALLAKGAIVAVLAEIVAKYGKRLLEIIAGLALGYMGLRTLTDHLGAPLPSVPTPL